MSIRVLLLLAVVLSLGSPVSVCAQQSTLLGGDSISPVHDRFVGFSEVHNAGNHYDEVVARLIVKEHEIRRQYQESAHSSVERFPLTQPNSAPANANRSILPVIFQSEIEPPASLAFAQESLTTDPTAALANFQPDEPMALDDEVEFVDEPINMNEVDAIANAFGDNDQVNAGIGIDFYGNQDQDYFGGLLIEGENVVMKVSGYVKADLIHDFDAIDSQDVFDTTAIPVDAAPRKNSRFHARQSRLNFDARWPTDHGIARIFIEGDFFGGSAMEEETSRDRFRLRHAYGEINEWILGQTWSTFADLDAQPYTLDFEGAVSSVSRRQALVRYTTPLMTDGVTLSLAVEDPRVIVEFPDTIEGSPRTETPDFVVRVRNNRGFARLQAAMVVREIGFQKVGEPVVSEQAWGINLSGDARLGENDRVYSQIVFGEGIGSFKGLPDVVGTAAGEADVLGLFSWMVGWTHNWNEYLWSNFTYSVNRIDPSPLQIPGDLRENTYLAANIIAEPLERVFVGAEYLYGTRENVDGAKGNANRLQFSFGFTLP